MMDNAGSSHEGASVEQGFPCVQRVDAKVVTIGTKKVSNGVSNAGKS